jgi:hypothetical protein
MSRTRIFRYVRFRDVDAYIWLGWFYDGSIMHAPHGCYAVTLEWLCDCYPVEPVRGAAE